MSHVSVAGRGLKFRIDVGFGLNPKDSTLPLSPKPEILIQVSCSAGLGASEGLASWGLQ